MQTTGLAIKRHEHESGTEGLTYNLDEAAQVVSQVRINPELTSLSESRTMVGKRGALLDEIDGERSIKSRKRCRVCKEHGNWYRDCGERNRKMI